MIGEGTLRACPYTTSTQNTTFLNDLETISPHLDCIRRTDLDTIRTSATFPVIYIDIIRIQSFVWLCYCHRLYRKRSYYTKIVTILHWNMVMSQRRLWFPFTITWKNEQIKVDWFDKNLLHTKVFLFMQSKCDVCSCHIRKRWLYNPLRGWWHWWLLKMSWKRSC